MLNHLQAVCRISGKLSLALLSSRFTFKTYQDTQQQNLHLQGHIYEAEYIIHIEYITKTNCLGCHNYITYWLVCSM